MKNDVIEINLEKVSGTPVFAGTRVPIKNVLFEIVFDKILTRQSSIDIRHSLRQTQHVVNNRIADIAV